MPMKAAISSSIVSLVLRVCSASSYGYEVRYGDVSVRYFPEYLDLEKGYQCTGRCCVCLVKRKQWGKIYARCEAARKVGQFDEGEG